MYDIMYTYILIIMLVGAGVFFTIRTKGVQFRLFMDGIKSMIEPKGATKDGEKKVSSFRALMISTAFRVDTGNIAGIATAIAAGGLSYYIERALGKRWMGVLFSALLIIPIQSGRWWWGLF